ncbi:MAG: phosphate signaling complex protein PhoU [Bacteroidetes bacterium]|nr:phosphate signaling complex protein PhoU [Bacteroidota bacterium]
MKNRAAHTPDLLRRKLLQLSAHVEENARRCVLAIRARDWQSAQRVIDGDDEVDALEISIEEDCVVLLQSGTLDDAGVRFVVAVLKINADLERVGDLAGNVSHRVLSLGQYDQLLLPTELLALAERTLSMLTHSLDALVDMDPVLARAVCDRDHEVNVLNRAMYDLVRDRILATPLQTERLIHLLSISRYLERIADYATNIAENVVYIAEGRIIRHSGRTARSTDNHSERT